MKFSAALEKIVVRKSNLKRPMPKKKRILTFLSFNTSFASNPLPPILALNDIWWMHKTEAMAEEVGDMCV